MKAVVMHVISLALMVLCSSGCGANPTVPSTGHDGPGQPIPDADFAEIAAQWEQSARAAGDARWSRDTGIPAQQRSYYDRPYAWYVLGYPDRADAVQQAYVDEYLDPIGGAAPPRHHEL